MAVEETMKFCPKCKTEKLESEFYKASSRKDGLEGICKICHNTYARKGKKQTDYMRNYFRNNPEKRHTLKRKAALKSNYDLTLEGYQLLLESQNYMCAICLSHETKSKRTKHFCVDHDHKTGKIRGLLCSSCNRAIGLLNDDEHVLSKALEYLRKNHA
jgi:Recombination endonuclease VII